MIEVHLFERGMGCRKMGDVGWVEGSAEYSVHDLQDRLVREAQAADRAMEGRDT
jgi:hypothetical protein